MKKRCNEGKNNPMYGVHRFGIEAANYKDGRCLRDYFCADCGKKLGSYRSKRCHSCAAKNSIKIFGHPNLGKNGALNSCWKGGRIRKGRYIYLRLPEHPYSNVNGYFAEHRLIVEKQIGRYLHKWEIVHHVNKVKDDNRLNNLMAFKNAPVHTKYEYGKKINPNDIIFDGSKKGD